jgi:hypothetical protein
MGDEECPVHLRLAPDHGRSARRCSVDADRPEQTPDEIERDGMRAGTLWAGPDASPEAIAAAGLPPDFFKDMREGASHKMGLVHSGRDWCDDPKCRHCATRPAPVGTWYTCQHGHSHPWWISCWARHDLCPNPACESCKPRREKDG